VKVSALGVEEQRVDVVLDVVGRAPTWNRVGDGYRVDARIVVEHVPDALLVPTGALFPCGRAGRCGVPEPAKGVVPLSCPASGRGYGK
jgi:hypothetical protein